MHLLPLETAFFFLLVQQTSFLKELDVQKSKLEVTEVLPGKMAENLPDVNKPIKHPKLISSAADRSKKTQARVDARVCVVSIC